MTIRIDACPTCGSEHKMKLSSVKTVRAAFKKHKHLITSKSSNRVQGTIWHLSVGLLSGPNYKLDDETMRREFPDEVWDWENSP